MLEILCKLLARFEPASGLAQVAPLQSLQVNELVFVTEHAIHSFETNDYALAHGLGFEVLQIVALFDY